MGKITDLLKKWGILRVGGVSGTYTNAKDRPFTNTTDDTFAINTPQKPSEPKKDK